MIGVSASDAIAWAEGRLEDLDLVYRATQKPEAVFVINLPGRSVYRRALELLLEFQSRGAVCLVFRTGSDVLDDHMTRLGAIASLREETNPIKYRFILGPKEFAAWLSRLRSGRSRPPKTQKRPEEGLRPW